jgi:2-polyprenyl-6-methoxyphenol hydroxylase-like FAD-dependent oxidoreductase
MRILIIGAGFGGLCLANGLNQEPGIDVQVFERHSDPSHDLVGYGIHIGAEGKRALKRCLHPRVFDRYMAISAAAGSEWPSATPT